MAANRADIELKGETVIVNYIADPSLRYGRFHLENHRLSAVTASVESAWMELAGRRRPLLKFSVFDLDREQTVDAAGFDIAQGTDVTFLLNFPKLAYLPSFGESAAVGLILRVSDLELQAVSSIQFEKRIPRGH